MILPSQIIPIGNFLKPHGIAGEITFAPYYDIDIKELKCLIVDIDAIPVPFFVTNSRKKGSDSLLLKIDGLDNEKEVSILSNKEVFALKDDVEISDDEEEGFSAIDFIGFTVTDDETGKLIGTIEYIDDSTENWLFMIKQNPDYKKDLIAIPVADEFITSIDMDNRSLGMSLPQGLLDI